MKDILKWGMGEHSGISPSKRSGVKVDVKRGLTMVSELSQLSHHTDITSEKEEGGRTSQGSYFGGIGSQYFYKSKGGQKEEMGQIKCAFHFGFLFQWNIN